MHNIDQGFLSTKIDPDELMDMSRENESIKKFVRAIFAQDSIAIEKSSQNINMLIKRAEKHAERLGIKLEAGIGGEEQEGAPLIQYTDQLQVVKPSMNITPSIPAPSAPAPSVPAPEQPPQMEPLASSNSSSGPQLPQPPSLENVEIMLYNTGSQFKDQMAILMNKLSQPLTDADVVEVRSLAAKIFQTLNFMHEFATEHRDNEARMLLLNSYKTIKEALSLKMIDDLEQTPALHDIIIKVTKMRKPFPDEPL
jgi:hypothetical protein